MTWADIVATGSGEADYRLVIEGAKYQFVESPLMRGFCYGASLLPAPGSVTWSPSGAVVTTGQADPYGGTLAVSIQDDSGAALEYANSDSVTYPTGSPFRGELWVKAGATTATRIYAYGTALGTVNGLALNTATGAISVLAGSFLSYSAHEAIDGWWRVRFEHAGLAETAIRLRVYPSGASAAATGTVVVYGASLRLRDGRKRVVGLQREGLMFTEREYLAGAECDVSIAPVRITETPEPDLNCATEIFSKIPAIQSWLAASMTAAATSATTHEATDLALGGYYHIGTEVVRVDAKAGASLTTIQRGQWGTTAQAHNVTNATSAESQQAPFLDGIEIWTKRRWWLYAHGPTETDVTDEGRLIMQGVIGAEPEEAEGEWTISLDSRIALLDQEVAASVENERKIRGIYYPGTAPFRVDARRSTDSTSANATGDHSTVLLSGFWETQEEFCFALQEALNNDATLGSWVSWLARPAIDGWNLSYITPAVSPRYVQVWGGSPVDGDLGVFVRFADDRPMGGRDFLPEVLADTEHAVLWGAPSAWAAGSTFSGSTPVLPEDLRRVPRTVNVASAVGGPDTDAQVAAFPAGRQYLGNVIGISVNDTLLIPQVDEDGQEAAPLELRVSSISTVTGSVDAYADSSITSPSGIVAAGAGAEAIALTSARSYTDVTGGSLYDFVNALVTAAPAGANDASTPWLLDDDIALATWQTVIAEAAAGHSFLERRSYTFTKGQRLEDVIKQECRLYGVYMCLDHEFKISVRRLTVETAEVASGLHVSASRGTHVNDDRQVEIRSGADGNVNVFELSRGYNQTDDKYTENPVHVVDDASVAKAKARRVIEVRPKTRAVDSEPTWEDAVRMSAPVRAMFGGKIVHCTVDVPITFWEVYVGDSVLLTDETAPHDGARGLHDPGQGLTSTRAIVVGREWRFDDASGTLTCLIVGLDVAGYTPTARVSSASGASGDWTLTTEANRYAPPGVDDASYFVANDRIRLIEWDAASPTAHLGAVITAIGEDIEVQLETPWAGPASGSGIWNLVFAPCDDGLLSTEQLRYAFIASSTRRLDDGTTTRNARLYAP